jgi:hypothetical protein
MRFKVWGYRLLSGVIGGGATALTTQAGLAVAEKMSHGQVQMLDFKQAGITALAGGFFAAVAYLKQSPLPPMDDLEAGGPGGK